MFLWQILQVGFDSDITYAIGWLLVKVTLDLVTQVNSLPVYKLNIALDVRNV